MQKPRRVVVVAVVALVVLAGLAVTVRVLLGGDRIKAAVESQASAALGSPVTIEAAVPRLLPRIGLDLTGITIGATREVTIDRARLTTGFRALLGRRVEDAEISVERSRIDLRWALSLLGALADSGPREQTATAPAALTIESIGTLNWRDVTLVAGARTLLVDLDSSFTAGDRFVVSRLHGRSEGSDLVASGELASVARRTGTFTIDAQTLDLDGLMAFLAAATPAGARENASADAAAAPPVAAVPLQLDITVAAKQGRALGVAFTKLETTGKDAGRDGRARGPEDGGVRRALRGVRRIRWVATRAQISMAGHVREPRRARARRVCRVAWIDDRSARRRGRARGGGRRATPGDRTRARHRARHHHRWTSRWPRHRPDHRARLWKAIGRTAGGLGRSLYATGGVARGWRADTHDERSRRSRPAIWT